MQRVEGFGADGVGFKGADAVGDDGVGEEVLVFVVSKGDGEGLEEGHDMG